jgi:uncharacterized membrane protein YbhN (UPF0104 family)
MSGPAHTPHPLRRLAARTLAVARRATTARSVRTQRALVGVAAAVFVVATVLAWRALPATDGPLSWPPLVVMAVVGVPALLGLNAVEYAIAVRSAGARVSLAGSLRLNVVASAVNLLPIPGSILVRIQGMHTTGVTYASATASTAVVGVAWISVSLIATGALQAIVGRPGRGAAVFAVGAGLAALAWGMVRLSAGVNYTPRLTAQLLVVEVARVAVMTGRFHLLLVALGSQPTWAQSVALTISVAVSLAIAVFPGGLGIRELSAAAIGPAVGLPASVALVAVALDRVIALGGLGIIAGAMALTTRGGVTDGHRTQAPEGATGSPAGPPAPQDHHQGTAQGVDAHPDGAPPGVPGAPPPDRPDTNT